jgi:hypothetical protein
MRICDGDDVEAPERLGAKTIPPKSQPPRK